MRIDALALTLAVLAYGAATLLLAAGSTGGVVAATRHPAWLAGNGLQAAGFLLAFVARADLPLLVVQPATTASVAVTCVLGAVLRRWRLTGRDVLGLIVVVVGIAGLAACAVAGRAVVPGTRVMLLLGVALVPCAVLAWQAIRRPGRPVQRSAMGLGAAAGAAFGIAAIAARGLAGDPLIAVRTLPGMLAVLTLGIGTVLGQVLLTAAISGGALAGPTSIMHVVETAGPAVAGVALLGDRIVTGRAPLAVVCGLVALVGSLLLIGHGGPVAPETAVADQSNGSDEADERERSAQ